MALATSTSSPNIAVNRERSCFLYRRSRLRNRYEDELSFRKVSWLSSVPPDKCRHST